MKEAAYIVCQGGGAKGIMYLGFHRALEAHLSRLTGKSLKAYLCSMQGFAGTSIGSLFSLMLLLNFSSEQVQEAIEDICREPRLLAPRPDLGMLFTEYGLDNGDMLRRVIARTLDLGGLSGDITFSELHRLVQRRFVVVATNLSKGRATYFSHAETPRVKVRDAIYMSMTLPFLFVPMEHDGALHVDGALSHNMPQAFEPSATLFVAFDCDEHARTDNLADYIVNISRLGIECCDWYKEHDCILLKLPKMVINTDMLDVTPHALQLRRACGYASTLMYLYPEFEGAVAGLIETLCCAFVQQISEAPGPAQPRPA